MADILIKGMEMPDRCYACPLCDSNKYITVCGISHGSYIEYRDIEDSTAIDSRPDWCPLVEIKPHGRLIDADQLVNVRYHDYEEGGTTIETKTVDELLWEMCEETAPTIIEREDGT